MIDDILLALIEKKFPAISHSLNAFGYDVFNIVVLQWWFLTCWLVLIMIMATMLMLSFVDDDEYGFGEEKAEVGGVMLLIGALPV